MVALDVRPANPGLNHVWVNGPLGQKVNSAALLFGLCHQTCGCFFKDPDELRADDLSLGLRVGDAFQRTQETFHRVNSDEADAKSFRVVAFDLFALPTSQQTVVNEHAGQLVPNGLVNQRRSHRGVHAPGQSRDHTSVTHLVFDSLDKVIPDLIQIPGCRTRDRLRHKGCDFCRPRHRIFR